jgi:toxin ParE1/3/4
MELTLTQSALDDLQSLQAYYADQGVPEIGQRFVNDIIEAVQRLLDHPGSGRKVPEFEQEQIREVILSPYRIVYLRESSLISIIRVWREERELVLPVHESSAWK